MTAEPTICGCSVSTFDSVGVGAMTQAAWHLLDVRRSPYRGRPSRSLSKDAAVPPTGRIAPSTRSMAITLDASRVYEFYFKDYLRSSAGLVYRIGPLDDGAV